MKRILPGALLAVLLVLPASAQRTAPGIRGGGGYESFTFRSPTGVGVESVSLLTLPLAAHVQLHDALSVDLQSAWSSARMTRADGSEATVSGVTDTELRVLLGLAGGSVQLTGIAQIPTGNETLTLDEADVAGLVVADVLPFRMANWGTGGGVGLSAAVTRPLGAFAGGISVGYVVAREFEPLEGSFQYRPGNQLSVRGALDRNFSNGGKASFVFTMLRFDADQIDQTNLFQAGNRYEGLASYAFPLGSTSAGILYAGYLRRDEGHFLGTSEFLPVEGLFFAGSGLEVPTRAGRLKPRADLRVLRRDNGEGQGYTLSAGADFEVPRSGFTVVPTVRGRFGNVVLREAAESRFTGFDLGLFIRFGGR